MDYGGDFGSLFGAVWGERGVAEFKLRLQADFNSHFTRHAPQAGVRRMKIYAQMDPKSHPKIDIWAIRGPTFEVFGRVLRNAILNTFSIGKNLAIFCKNLRFECELGVRWRSSGSEG